jgi:hypothetical protein
MLPQKYLIEWHRLINRQSYAGKLESYEETRLFQLNHRVMEIARDIHNTNMLKKE